MKETILRPMYLVEKLLKDTDYKVSHAYEDLVFIEHSLILIQFSAEHEEELFLYLNTEVEAEEGEQLRQELSRKAREEEIILFYAGTFALEQVEGKEEIALTFHKLDSPAG